MRRLALALVVSLASLAVSTGAALAQRMPDMATLDRGDGISRLGIDFGAAFVDDDIVGVDAALRFDIFGQYVTRTGIGVYGSLPISTLIAEGDNVTALANLELGGLYVVDGPAFSFVFRGGVSLPTGADDDVDEVLTNFVSTWTRLTDFAQSIPNTAYLRLSFSPMYHADRLFFRADFGVDVPIGDDEDGLGQVFGDPETLFRVNVGGGIDLGTVALMAELVNLASSDSFDDGEDDDFVHTFAVSARFMGEGLQPYLTFGVPVDEFSRDVVDFFLGAGLQVAF